MPVFFINLTSFPGVNHLPGSQSLPLTGRSLSPTVVTRVRGIAAILHTDFKYRHIKVEGGLQWTVIGSMANVTVAVCNFLSQATLI